MILIDNIIIWEIKKIIIYEDYKNQDYYNGKQNLNNPSSQIYNQREENNNGNREPYTRPDYYANNRPRTMD